MGVRVGGRLAEQRRERKEDEMDGERWEKEGRERGGEVEERRQRGSRRRHADTFLLFGFVGHPGR